MTLLLFTVVTASVLLASTTATPPPGYIKQPDNDKNPPSYRYNYEIQSDSGEVQSKTEARKGEHATGRYYVNSKQASTDVKYYADDWGYHPLVKYSLADDHSSSSASLAFGEKGVKSYDSDNETPSPTNLPQSGESERLAAVTQPYRQAQQSIVYSSDLINHRSQQSEANSVDIHYVTSQPLSKTVSTLSDTTFPSSTTTTTTTQQQHHQYHQQQSNHLSSQENDLSPSSEEDQQLFAEHAGRFGARVRDDEAYSSPGASIHSGADALSNDETRDGRYYHAGLLQKNRQIPASYLPGLGYFTLTTASPISLDSGVTANSIESDATVGNNNAHKYAFFKPIVVAEPEPQRKEPPFQYSTTFECEDDKSPSTPNPLLYSDDTASSHVLNSIQAGVSLVNAGEAHLIGKNDDARSPAPVEEKIDDYDQPAQLTNLVAVQTHAQNYVGINPAFGSEENSAQQNNALQTQITSRSQPQAQALQAQQQQQQQQQTPDVEIQKSIEIYHSLPQHEIHYTGTFPTQVTQVNQQQQQQYEIRYAGTLPTQVTQIDQQQQQKHSSSGSDEDDNTRRLIQSQGDSKYEMSSAYSKVIGVNKPVYVVQPATYILDNNSAPKSSPQTDENQQYERDNSQLVKFENQQSEIYKTESNHQDGLQTNTPKPEQYEKQSAYVTQSFENIPIPQPYPIAVEISVPQPYPVHIEKVIEKKIPIPIHIPIPQPYPVEKIVEKIVEKKVPYPVEVPKYIEKPATSLAPHYGQQNYGVSYQQVMKPQNNGLYSHKTVNQHLHRYVYNNPVHSSANVNAKHEQNPFLKKHFYNSYLPPKSNGRFHRRHAGLQRPSDIMGPPPIQRQAQHQQRTSQPRKSFVSHPTTASRRARNHDSTRHQKGNFRQSKIEYGFKPPMVPSVQYDEETASKIER